jgi:hypothetical protein
VRSENVRFFPHIEAPTKNEISEAIRDLKRYKAQRKIIFFFAGLLKYEGHIGEMMPEEWHTSIICPVHKKGGKSECSK